MPLVMHNFLDTVEKFDNVKSLSLIYVDDLHSNKGWPFRNLKTLILTRFRIKWSWVESFFSSNPNLVNLILKDCLAESDC